MLTRWTSAGPEQEGKAPGRRQPVGFERAAHLLVAQRKAHAPQHHVLPHPDGRADGDVAQVIGDAGALW